MLLMCWMVLRADDVQWIDPSRMHLNGTCVRMILRRTKTTGPGKEGRGGASLRGAGCVLWQERDWAWSGMGVVPFRSF